MFAILMVVDSMHYIFARLLLPHAEPAWSAFFVLAAGTLEVGVYGFATGRISLRAFRPHARFYVAIGFLVAASTVLSYESMAYLDPGTAALLGKTTTLFTVGFGLVWLHERLSQRQMAGAGVALAGVFLFAFQPGDFFRLGALLVLGSSLFYALHTALVKRSGEGIGFMDFFFFRLLSTSAFLLLMALGMDALRDKPFAWPGATGWLLLAVTGTVDVVVSRTLYYLTLRSLPMSVHAIILTLSPVVSVAVALVLFGTFPTFLQLAGGLLILGGVLLVSLAPPPAAAPTVLPADGAAQIELAGK
jgi:drug/metabolite transporter (DMT)-like permease